MTLHHVARLDRRSGGEVLRRRDDADDVEPRLEPTQRFERPQNGRRAGHIELHVFHVLRRLDRDAARIERDALPHQRYRWVGRSRAAVFEHDEARLLLATLCHRQQRAHVLLPHLGPVEHAVGEAVLVGELLGPVGQVGRRAHVAGQHLEVAGQEMAGRDRFAQPLPGADGLGFLRVARDGDRLDLGLRLVGRGLELGEGPGPLGRSFDHDLPHVGGGDAVAGFGGERERELRRAQGPGALRGDGGSPSNGGARHFPRLSQPHQQQALRLGAARVEQRRFITLALEVAARDRACHDPARRAVQLRERRGDRATLRQRHGEQRRLDLGERCGEGRAGHLRHARLCLRRIARSRPRSRRASAGRGRT